MTAQQDWRDEFVTTLDHIDGAFGRVSRNSGPKKDLTAPDVHKLSEGLFLSAWSHWEEFLRYLVALDLATTSSGALVGDVRKFRYKGSAMRLAWAILDHPDESKWVEWSDSEAVKDRANALLGSGNRYHVLGRHKNDLKLLRRIRNAVAHKSDQAWAAFIKLAKAPPFSIANNRMKGITTGRFLSSHSWGSRGGKVLPEAVAKLKSVASLLVP